MVLIAHIADVHLGKRQYGLMDREEDFYAAFRQAIEAVKRERPDLVLLAGDLFDAPRPPNKAIKVAQDALKELSDAGVKCFAVLGDHDFPKRRDLSPLRLIPDLRLLDTDNNVSRLRIDGEDVTIAALPFIPAAYRTREVVQQFIPLGVFNRSALNVVLAHVPLEGLLPHEPGVSLDDLPENVSYVALGHIHKRELVKKGGRVVGGYPGSLEITDVADIEHWRKEGKGFLLVDLSRGEPEVHKVDLDVRPQYVIRGELETVRAEVRRVISRQHNRKPLLHIYLEVRDDASRLTAPEHVRKLVNNKALIRLHVNLLRPERTRRGAERVGELSLIDVIAEVVGDKGLAAEILKLIEVLGRDQHHQYIDDLIESICSRRDVWSKLLKTEPAPKVRTDAGDRAVRKGGRGLLSYLS